MRNRRTLALYVVLLAVCSLARADRASPRSGMSETREIVVLPLGDSITEGVPTEDGYRAFLKQELAARGIVARLVGTQTSAAGAHEGWSGYTAEEMLPRVDAALAKSSPDVILLHIGTNDIGLGADADTAVLRITRLLERIDSRRPAPRRPRVLLAQIIPMALAGSRFEAVVRRLNQRLPSVAAERRKAGQPVEIVDMHSAFDVSRDMHDALHPNEAGYRKLARAWAAAIKK